MTDATNDILTVSELNASARFLLEEAFRLVWIEGEISNLRIPASGHWYFTLKDSRAQVRCVLFRGRQRGVRMVPRDGVLVRVQGAVSLYEERGEFQIIAERMEDAGDGALRRALDALRQRLHAEGLFGIARKRPLPVAPTHLALITSGTGAALQDMLEVLRQRCPIVRVTLLPVAVQGEAAAPAIAAALAAVATLPDRFDTPPVDAVILGRGGGSSEDLHAFNDERVVRAIADCIAPVIAAIGHETDVTLADLVADLRAPTPSAAAAAAVPDLRSVRDRLTRSAASLLRAQRLALRRAEFTLAGLRARLRHPGRTLDDLSQRLDERDQRLKRAMRQRLTAAQARLDALRGRLRPPQARLTQEQLALAHREQRLRQAMAAQLERSGARLALYARALTAVSPLATIERGYAVVRDGDAERRVLTSVAALRPGAAISVQLRDGSADCHVDAVHLVREPRT